MLNPFPELLVYSTLAPFILRVVLGFVFIDLGILNFKKSGYMKVVGIVEIAGAIMLFLGLYTQIAALVFLAISAFDFYIEYKDASILKRDIVFYLLVLAISLSLLLQGAGAFARDLPL